MDPIGKISDLVDSGHNLVVATALYQIGAKDWPTLMASSANLQSKIEDALNVWLGRTLGYTPFPGSGYQPVQTFKLANALNNTTYAGAVIWGLSELGILSSKWGSRGKKILLGGAIGGVFDDPPLYNTGQMGPTIMQGNSGTWLPQQNKVGWR